MSSFINRYGLIAIFFGAAIEGDGTLLLGGVTAHLGLLRLPTVLVVGALGGLLSDMALYALGRSQAARVGRWGPYRRIGPTIERIADRYGPWQIVTSRFIYGTRNASMVFWGLRRLTFSRFAAIDTVGVAIWATSLTLLGYAFSSSAQALLGKVQALEHWLLVALVLVAATLVVVHRAWRWRVRGVEGTGDRGQGSGNKEEGRGNREWMP